MKIALVIFHADPARGGAERYTIDLAEGLSSRGHEVYLLSSSFADSVPPQRQVLIASAGFTRAGRYLQFLASLDRHLETHSYDIVHAMLPVRKCDAYHPHAGIAVDALATGHLKRDRRLMRGMSFVFNQLNRRRRLFAAVERDLLQSANPPVVLCLSDYVRGVASKHYSLDASHMPLLFNGIDTNRFDPASRPEAGIELRKKLGIDPDRVIGLIIAQDFARKGLASAIEALARVSDTRLMLMVVGKEDPAPYRRLAEQQHIADRVIFAGSTKDPYSFYRAADFFVLPTRHDPCSLVVLEALAMGLPVISTVFNGACEIMQDGIHGSVLDDPNDIDSLAGAMKRVLDADIRAQASTQCLALRQKLSVNSHLDRLLEIYGMITERAKSAKAVV